MNSPNLPENIIGSWIWATPDFDNKHFVFHKEFHYDSSNTSSIDLYIASHGSFVLYVNNQVIDFGPTPAPHDKAYVHKHDLSFNVEEGKNTLYIICGAEDNNYHQPALWCQTVLNGGEQQFATDINWHFSALPSHYPNLPFSSTSHKRFEIHDLRLEDFKTAHKPENTNWQVCLQKSPCIQQDILPLNISNCQISNLPFISSCSKGKVAEHFFHTHINCANFCDRKGTYVGYASLKSSDAQSCMAYIHSDIRYKIYINNKLVAHNDEKLKRSLEFPFLFTNISDIELKEGWNDLFIIMEAAPEHNGFTLNIPNLPASEVSLHSQDNAESPNAWLISSKLRAPFAKATGSIDTSLLEFILHEQNYSHNPSTFLMSKQFEADDTFTDSSVICAIQEGEFITFTLDKTHYGLPQIELSGSNNDIVDIIYSDKLIDGCPLPFTKNKSFNTDSIILSSGSHNWNPLYPKGMKYLTVFARKSSQGLSINSPSLHVISTDFTNEGFFESSDELLNKIYKTSTETLKSCLTYDFLDSPTGDQQQFANGAYIMGHCSLIALGANEYTEKALRNFQLDQYETGELPAISCFHKTATINDFPLYWVILLQKHILFTEDTNFLNEMRSCLDSILDYYSSNQSNTNSLLRENFAKRTYICSGYKQRTGQSTPANALYSRALYSASWLYSILDDPKKAEACTHQAQDIAAHLRDENWDETTHIFRDATLSASSTFEANLIALYGAVCPPEHYLKLFRKLFNEEKPFFKDTPSIHLSPYLCYFILDTAFSLDKREWALEFIKWYWGSMLELNEETWLQYHTPKIHKDIPFDVNTCQGNGSSPIIFLIQEIAGIKPETPGFTSVTFDPMLSAVDKLSVRVPTPRGKISIQWEKQSQGVYDFTITSPFKVQLKTKIPDEIIEASNFMANENIEMIQEVD